MCKVAMFSGIKASKIQEAWQLSKALAPHMSVNDDDGFGYAAITKDGTVFGERWLDPSQAFSYREDNKRDKELVESLGDALEPLSSDYSQVGNPTKTLRGKAVSIILHARFATCEKGLRNVHPFFYKGAALIHNGVISNEKQLMLKYDRENTRLTTCDSESLVYSYVENNIKAEPNGIQTLGSETGGYYACAVLTKGPDGAPIMDVFKSASAPLYGTYVPQLGCFVYCTSQDILKDALRECGFTWYRFYKINPGNLIRHNAVTGKSKVVSSFSERVYSNNSYSGYSGYRGQYYDDLEYSDTPGAMYPYGRTNDLVSSDKSTGKIIDASGDFTKTYSSWEEYQEAKYGKNNEELSEKEISDLIGKELSAGRYDDEELPSEQDIPKFIEKLPPGKRNGAFDDYIEILERFKDERGA